MTDVRTLPEASIMPPEWFPKEYSLRWHSEGGHFVVVWEEDDKVMHASVRNMGDLLPACRNIGGLRFEREYPGQHGRMVFTQAECVSEGKRIPDDIQMMLDRYAALGLRHVSEGVANA